MSIFKLDRSDYIILNALDARFGDKLGSGKRDSFIDSETESHRTGNFFGLLIDGVK